ncbi:MAG: polysaccharide deacetylase family protein [Planctomycetes bacterium]|nr:polysaccharide deacetylase family protein [Planctomycetota bacterium]
MRWVKSCFELVSLSEGIRRLRSGTLTKTCLALTFDDGLKSVADHAVPVLIRHGIPAALFVNHARLTGQRCWIYDVAQLESEGRKEALEEVFGTSCPGSLSSYLWHHAPAEVLARRSGLANLSSSLKGNGVEYINHEELAKLLQSPLMELGNHSLDHPRFSRLDANEQCRQINDNAAAPLGSTSSPAARAGLANSYRRSIATQPTAEFGRSSDTAPILRSLPRCWSRERMSKTSSPAGPFTAKSPQSKAPS